MFPLPMTLHRIYRVRQTGHKLTGGTFMFCSNNSWGSCSWIIIIIILLFACGGSSGCGRSSGWNNGCGCNQNSSCGC